MRYLYFYKFSLINYILACVLVLPLVSCAPGASEGGGSGSALIQWAAPSEREDATALGLSEIAGYHIYYGVEAGVYIGKIGIDDPTATEYLVEGIPTGQFYAVMTTVDTEGRESRWSSPELQASF